MEVLEKEKVKRVGRPRSQTSKEAILKATWELMLHSPLDEVTIEGIAEKAGVGKTTIYRWWDSKEKLAIDAVFHKIGSVIVHKAVQQGISDLTESFNKLIDAIGDTGSKAIVGDIVAKIFVNPFLEEYFKQNVESVSGRAKS